MEFLDVPDFHGGAVSGSVEVDGHDALATPPAALGGVPFLTKDLYFREGQPTFAGSTFLPEILGPARRTSTLPAAFEEDAGAVECGRTQLNEFAFGLSGENPHFGDCPHPADGRFLAGGSSSGSAFAVARGLVPFALATDTAGSIRIPAHFCGIARLKPTCDRWSNRGSVGAIPGQALLVLAAYILLGRFARLYAVPGDRKSVV